MKPELIVMLTHDDFTIGSAFFDHKFGGSIAEQFDQVCAFIES